MAKKKELTPAEKWALEREKRRQAFEMLSVDQQQAITDALKAMRSILQSADHLMPISYNDIVELDDCWHTTARQFSIELDRHHD